MLKKTIIKFLITIVYTGGRLVGKISAKRHLKEKH